MIKHTFSVCAYKESPYLRQCLESLMAQTVQSKIIICTSTPNNLIENVAREFECELFTNNSLPNIASDWNFAIQSARTPYVTIAHQDDYYCSQYSAEAIRHLDASEHPLIFFTNYGEIRNDKFVDTNLLLNIKRMLLQSMKNRKNWASISSRRNAIRFGSSICCPSVTYAIENLKLPIFEVGMKSNIDWQAWDYLSNMVGDFIYDPQILMYHRIHEDSETSATINDNIRTQEDLQMLEHFWPKPIARIINSIYSKGQKSNT